MWTWKNIWHNSFLKSNHCTLIVTLLVFLSIQRFHQFTKLISITTAWPSTRKQILAFSPLLPFHSYLPLCLEIGAMAYACFLQHCISYSGKRNYPDRLHLAYPCVFGLSFISSSNTWCLPHLLHYSWRESSVAEDVLISKIYSDVPLLTVSSIYSSRIWSMGLICRMPSNVGY